MPFRTARCALAALDVLPDDARSRRSRRRRAELLARAALAEALIFTDVFGATPCNIAQRLADGVQVKVVAGVNVPMLWRTLCYADESLDAVVARALAGRDAGRDAGGDGAAAEPALKPRP